MRLKNLAIGYNLPKKYSQKIGLKQIHVYFSGDNLLTFTDYPGMDPERIISTWFFNISSNYYISPRN